MLLFLLLVVVVAAVGGLWPGSAAAVGGFLLVNWYFIAAATTRSRSRRPRTCSRSSSSSPSARSSSSFVALAARRAAEGARARAEAEALARLAGSSTVSAVLEGLRRVLGLEGAAVLHRHEGGWRIEAASGERVPESPEASSSTIDLDAEHVLALSGRADPRRGPADARRLRERARGLRPPRRARGRGRGGGRSLCDERAAGGAPGGRLARPAHADLRDQGLGHEPAPAGRRVDAGGAAGVPARRSTRRPTGSTRSSATFST